jgi:hypothetical protein
MELHSSRGYESSSSKLLMRLTVVASDLMCECVRHMEAWSTWLVCCRLHPQPPDM